MKTIVKKFFVLVIYMLGFVNALATPDPPMPNGRNQGIPPPPPGLPIDENISFLTLITIVFGMYVIRNQTIKSKKL